MAYQLKAANERRDLILNRLEIVHINQLAIKNGINTGTNIKAKKKGVCQVQPQKQKKKVVIEKLSLGFPLCLEFVHSN